jgi:hypothetical protein
MGRIRMGRIHIGRIRIAVALSTMAALAPGLVRPALADVSFTRYYTAGGGVTLSGANVVTFATCLPADLNPVPLSPAVIPRPGGTCFDIPTGSSVDITVEDATTLPVTAAYSFNFDTPFHLFCGSAKGVPIPQGSTRLVVAMVANVSPTDCLGAAPPTAGSITVTYR